MSAKYNLLSLNGLMLAETHYEAVAGQFGGNGADSFITNVEQLEDSRFLIHFNDGLQAELKIEF